MMAMLCCAIAVDVLESCLHDLMMILQLCTRLMFSSDRFSCGTEPPSPATPRRNTVSESSLSRPSS